jgi:hypothetical protein
MKMRGLTIGAGVLALASGIAMGDTFHDLASFQAASENRRLCNFDVDENGVPFTLFNQIGNRYGTFGVSFPPGNYTAGTAGGPSAPNGWFKDTPDGSGPGVFNASFTATDITAVGVYQCLFAGNGGATLVAFDSGGTAIGSVTSDSINSTIDFFGLTTTVPIARIEITYVVPAGGWGLDDLYFGNAIGGGCAADFNGDNQADFFDYLDFVAAFDAEDDSADFNGDNQVDFFDYLDFVSAFDEGCD